MHVVSAPAHHLSVRDNVAFGLRERRVPAAEIERRVGEALALVRESLVYQGAQTELTARLADGQRVVAFVTEPAPMLTVGQAVRLLLPADAFMPLA